MILSFATGSYAMRSPAGLSTALSRGSSSRFHHSTLPQLAAIFQEVRTSMIVMPTDN